MRKISEPMTEPALPATVPPREERLVEHVMPAIRATAVTLVLTGLAYPLVMTGVAQALFHRKAEGSFKRTARVFDPIASVRA